MADPASPVRGLRSYALLSRPLELVRLDALVFVKAIAISLIVGSHAGLTKGLQGGLNVLMIISGMTMAAFAFRGTSTETIRAFRSYALRIAIPGVVITALSMAVKWEFSWQELALFSNWITDIGIALLPISFIQMVVQLLLLIALVFWAFDLTPKIQKSPACITGIMLAGALLSTFVSHMLWDTNYLRDNLPHLYAWSFILGWVYWAVLIKGGRSFRKRLMMTGVLFACGAIALALSEAYFWRSRLMWLTVLGLVLIWVDSVRLPRLIAHPLSLLSQATLYIFLFHMIFFYIVSQITGLPMYSKEDPWPIFLGGMIGSMTVFIAVRAMTITRRRMLRHVVKG